MIICNMAMNKVHKNANKIVEIFTNMSYEDNDDDMQLFKQWKASHLPLQELSFEDLKINAGPSNKRIKNHSERTILLQKFANLIEKSMELICQMCANSNIRKEDTKKAISVFLDTLRFYAMFPMVLDDDEVSDGRAYCIFETYVYPGLLGMVLGPILAMCNSIIIVTNNQHDFCVLLSELATEAGYPVGSITVLNVTKIKPFEIINSYLGKVVHFGHDDIWNSNRFYNPRLLNIVYGKTSMIVFDSADQQSACQVLIDAVWSYNGQLPWSVDTVYVQENIWDTFIATLKRTTNQRSSDFSKQQFKSSQMDQMISDAKSRGIEIYHAAADSGLVMFIGERVYETNVIKPNEKRTSPSLTVLPFRTINEGVALVNNTRQGIAASVWGENVSQVHEVARKLQVGTVWINCYGVLKPEVTFEPWKESGMGHFGGVDGLLEYHIKHQAAIPLRKFKNLSKTKSQYSVATASQITWAKMGYTNRSKCILKLIEDFKQLNANGEKWITAIYDSLTSTLSQNSGHFDINDFNEFDFRSFKDPVGIIILEDYTSARGKEFMFRSLLLGNVVMLQEIGIEDVDLIQSVLIGNFPKGVINFIANIWDVPEFNDAQNIMFISQYSRVGTENIRKYRHMDDKSVTMHLVRTKNIWTSIGQTYC